MKIKVESFCDMWLKVHMTEIITPQSIELIERVHGVESVCCDKKYSCTVHVGELFDKELIKKDILKLFKVKK